MSTSQIFTKIKYQIVFNHNGYLKKDGTSVIAIQLSQGRHRAYISTKIYIKPEQWDNTNRQIVDATDPKWALKLNSIIIQIKHNIEKIECDFIHNHAYKSVNAIKEAYYSKLIPSATISEFIDAYLVNANIKESTKDNYRTLKNSLYKFNSHAYIEDIDYDFIVKYQKFLQSANITTGTISSRLILLKAILNEAVKRQIMTSNPIENIKIENAPHKIEYLQQSELQLLENYYGKKKV